ncbi:uncharacterized protein Z519_11745 [Cladophialophora bantiana CBS 173.52]|uniref:Uncharacterized protein n=1 Tax=Cladophialophora bantiana (strain ATCC 10958 / CBS 173.52 / CDC B-1940 / NIH 8579) TaxID=1442370 RepID=A0A0D2ECB4_CLAB1|nr:uncharacterized protein Z519_11745 [Cladophialophora bantiana CBS 173.52]KIW87771.1 hypothetical protein Z519_11745 [Cladophialophora bantiana CBS 173.52]
MCVINGLSFGYLAYHGKVLSRPAESSIFLSPSPLLQNPKASFRPLNLLIRTTRSAPEGSLLRYLYILAATASASGVPYALTFLRRTNGALSRKADRLAGPGGGEMALTYAFNEKRSIDRDRKMNTEEAIKRWQWHNYVRTWVLVLGTVAGALAVAMD